jgi:hypothetical protein
VLQFQQVAALVLVWLYFRYLATPNLVSEEDDDTGGAVGASSHQGS